MHKRSKFLRSVLCMALSISLACSGLAYAEGVGSTAGNPSAGGGRPTSTTTGGTATRSMFLGFRIYTAKFGDIYWRANSAEEFKNNPRFKFNMGDSEKVSGLPYYSLMDNRARAGAKYYGIKHVDGHGGGGDNRPGTIFTKTDVGWVEVAVSQERDAAVPFLFKDPETGGDTPLNLMPPSTYSAGTAQWAVDFQTIFGDAGGKLRDLLAALNSNNATIRSKLGAEYYEVNDNAAAQRGESVVALSIPDIQDKLEHYMNWWFQVYNALGWPEYAMTESQIRAQFEGAKSAATSQANRLSSSSGSGGPSSGSGGNVIEFPDGLGNFVFFTDDFFDYPCIVIEPVAGKTHGTGAFYTATWQHFRRESYRAGDGAYRYEHDLFGGNPHTPINNSSQGSMLMHATGTIWTPEVRYGAGDLDGQDNGTLGENAGFWVFGFYGALGLAPDTPVTPPPVTPDPDPHIPVDNVADDIGTYYLMDYEMNHVFDSMARHYSDSVVHDHAKLNPGIVTTDPSQYSNCGHGNNDYKTETYSEVLYQEDEGSGPSVTMDNAGPVKTFLHNNATEGGIWWLRDEIKAGQVKDSNDVSDYVIDYGFNLVRKHFDDARAYSKMIDQSVNKDYLEQTLGMYEAIITNNPTRVTNARDSFAVVGPTAGIHDELSWHAVYKQTNSGTKYETYSTSHTYSCGTSRHPRTCTCNYNGSRAAGGIQAYSTCKGTASVYSVGLYSIAHKYMTASIPVGYAQPKETRPFDYRPTTDGNGTDDGRQYRGSNTIDPRTEVTYVPEVPMLVDEVPGPELTHTPKKVITMGEESRKSKLILMTLYRVTGASTPVKGVVYSDTAVGGDAGLSSQTNNRRLALTAGGDFTVKADTNMQINLYGYALDLIEPGDAGYDTVTKGNDVKAGWGNSGSRNKLMETYQTWAAAMLNPKNYQADFEMTIGTKEYNSFSATVGSFSSKASQSTETGQYNIYVKHGKIQDDAGYQAFIAQLADDYGCSIDEAKTLFTNSDMASAIIKAIEHDESSLNKSNPAKYAINSAGGEIGTFNEPDRAAEIGGLGNASHWYDEEVRVFVIRRFMTPAAKVTNIIAQDKMDIGNAMGTLGGDTMGSFNLNVWFRSNCYTRAVTEYYPSTDSYDNKTDAISDGGLIIAGVRVNGADFNITTATTATGKH